MDQDVVVDWLGRRGGAKKAAVEALDAIGGVGSFKDVSIELLEDGKDEVDVAGTPDSSCRRRVLPRVGRLLRRPACLRPRRSRAQRLSCCSGGGLNLCSLMSTAVLH